MITAIVGVVCLFIGLFIGLFAGYYVGMSDAEETGDAT